MVKKLFTQKDIARIRKTFTQDDLILATWLKNCREELIQTLLDVLRRQFTNSVITDCFLHDKNLIDAQSPIAIRLRTSVATLLVYELKRYSAHSFHFLSKYPGYDSILTTVLKHISKQMGSKQNFASKTVDEKERALIVLIMSDDKSIKRTSTNKKILNNAMALFVKASIKKVTPRLLKRLLPTVGWILLAKDIYNLGQAASRVTVPFVITIAMYRANEKTDC